MAVIYDTSVVLGVVMGLTACATAADGLPKGLDSITAAGGAAGSAGGTVGTDGPGSAGSAGTASASAGGTSSLPGGGGASSAGGLDGTGGVNGLGGATASGGSPSAGGASAGPAFPPVSDFTAAGTFTPESGEEGPQCTIFRPSVLGEEGRRHPVIVWGNGTFNTPANYTDLFNHFASQGFIVAAADTSNSGSGAEMIACLEYVLTQNGTAGTPYEGHVDTDHLAASGYSQGGAGCLMAGKDPRFTVTAPVSPFVVLPLGGYDPGAIAAQTHPMFMISGDADTVAAPAANQQPIFQQAPVPIFWATHAGSTHFEVLGTGGAYRGPLTAWFRYKLMGDPAARDWFETPPCTLCTAPGWTTQHSSMWQ